MSVANVDWINDMGGLDLKDGIDYALLKTTRTIVLNGDVDEYLSGKLTRMFSFISGTPDIITVLISSHGGEIDAGESIIRAIQDARERGCSVVGEVRGYAMSMGAFILQHCDQRLASANDIIMVHGVTSVTIGDIRNQSADLALSKKMMDNQATYFAERNTSADEQYHNKEYWLNLLQDNTPHYYFGEEAFEKGLIDIVL